MMQLSTVLSTDVERDKDSAPYLTGTGSRSPRWTTTVRLPGQLVDLPSSLRCQPVFQVWRGLKPHRPKLTVFGAAANSLFFIRGQFFACGTVCGITALSVGTDVFWAGPALTRFDLPKAGQYPQTVARKSAIRLRPRDPLRGPRRPAARHLRPTSQAGGRTVMPETPRRTPWPRASGPSSRTTGAEPAFTDSGCGCALVPDGRSCPAGAARAAAL